MPSRLTVVLVSLMLATPAVIFWSWLAVRLARVAILCPERCWCDPGGYQVSCHNTTLTPDPVIPLTNVRILEHYFNNVTMLEMESFVSMTELEILSLLWCELRTINLGAFNGLTKLKELSIWGNKISKIKPGTFENLRNLECLYLGFNGLKDLEVDAFRGLVNLKYIELGGNKLQYLDPDTFFRLPNLQAVSLQFNPDLQIPTGRHFINSHSLSHLDISRCNVSSVSVETFANVSALERLDLRCNNLSSVDINILRKIPKLSALYLYVNPLQCDCKLQDVWRSCQQRNIRLQYIDMAPECETLKEVKGVLWGVLEKGQCLQDNVHYYGDYNNISYSNTDTTVSNRYEYIVLFLKQYQVPIYAFLFTFGTISNAILLIIIICNKDMRTVPNMYILNLAISDIIYLTVLFSEAFASRISAIWLYGDVACKFLPFCRRLSVGLSAYSVALFSVQRYKVTVNSLHVRVSSQATWRVTVVTICGVWIVAALFAVPSALSMYLCEEFKISRRITYYQRVVIFELLVSCVLPLCVIAFSYIVTARYLVESSFSAAEWTRNSQLKKRRNTAKIVVGLTVVFLISYVPYHVFWAYIICTVKEKTFYEKFFDILFISTKNTEILRHSNYKLQYMYLISTCFLLINSCLNPIALFCTSSPIRQFLKRYLTCFCKANSPSTDVELTRRN